jgi:hypothetical protein
MNIEALISEDELLAVVGERFNVGHNDTVEKIGKLMGAWVSAQNFPPSPNTVHFAIWMAVVKSVRVIGCGARGRSG